MITHIKTKGFKGFNIDEDIPAKALFYGKNRSGKSSRAAAAALTILGYIPFATKPSKNNADILNDYGVGDALTVSVVFNGVEFERHFYRTDKGVSQRLRVDKKKHSAADFAVELEKAGSPRIIDVNAFMSLSDQKKIDSLFDLFPPSANLKNLDSEIEKAKKEVSRLEKQERTNTAVIQRLTASKSEIQLPAGTLAEIQADIKKLTEEVKTAQDELKQAEIADAETQAAEKAVEKHKSDRAAKEKSEQKQPSNHVKKQEPQFSDPGNKRIHDFVSGKELKPDSEYFGPDPVESIERIIDTLNNAGCKICAAAIVAKQELRKFKKEAAA